MSTHAYPDSPQIAVGVIVIRGDKVLLVRRGQPPGEGLWAVPGGSVELGETLKEAAEREVKEETGVTVRAGGPVHAFDLIDRDDDGKNRFHYVIVDLTADYVSGNPRPGDDVHEARWVTQGELPELRVSKPTRQVLEEKVTWGRR
jgi:ADP-ribose pyrophosphatase